jgi:anti-sigma28 factor (negative regulator of flagellin synthesis)
MVRIGSSGIDNLGSAGIGSVGGVASEPRTSAAASNPKSDSVSLSSAAGLVALAKSSATSRLPQIQNLKAQIKSGNYQADAGQVSHAVVESHISG